MHQFYAWVMEPIVLNRFLRNFSWQLYFLQSFCQKTAEKKSFKKYVFLYFVLFQMDSFLISQHTSYWTVASLRSFNQYYDLVSHTIHVVSLNWLRTIAFRETFHEHFILISKGFVRRLLRGDRKKNYIFKFRFWLRSQSRASNHGFLPNKITFCLLD